MKFVVLSLVLTLVITTVLSNRDEKSCNPGESKKIECNNCHCTNGGLWACTRKRCLPPRIVTKCEPGSTFQKGCNTCHCNADGTDAVCTLKACLDLPLPKNNN